MTKNKFIKKFIVIIFLMNIGCENNKARDFDGVWKVTHFIVNNRKILPNDLDILLQNTPISSRIYFYLDSKKGKVGFNYSRNKTTNSDIEFINDSLLKTVSQNDELFNGKFFIHYSDTVIKDNLQWSKKEEKLHLKSENTIIVMFRSKLIDKIK